MVVPDPRALSIHKVWLSEQPDREAIKKKRDHDQSLAIALLVIKYLPQYGFETSKLRMFPKDVVQKLKRKISKLNLNTELDFISGLNPQIRSINKQAQSSKRSSDYKNYPQTCPPIFVEDFADYRRLKP